MSPRAVRPPPARPQRRLDRELGLDRDRQVDNRQRPPTPATEAIAASLPIGAAVGPAGLGTLPYELTFRGQFFQVADFIAGLDRLVDMRDGGHVAADGRLLTIDGFALSQDERQGFPWLEASFTVTSRGASDRG